MTNDPRLDALGDTPGSDVCGCTRVMLAATCPDCGGDGWEIGHEDECYEQGDCVCAGVQVPCNRCGGTGDVS
jgi:hypothetical protein